MPYQLRIPGDRTLGDLVTELAKALARQVEPSGEIQPLAAAIETVIKHRLRVDILTTDVCGAQVMCDEGVEPTLWNLHPDPSLVRVDPNHPEHVKRFRLEEIDDLESWLGTLTATIHSVLPPRYRDAKPQMIGRMIKSHLGPYLFRNELCGGTDLCRLAAPVADVWNA